MGWLQFIASVISSLAWPAAVVLLVFLLRLPLTKALLSLTHLKYKDLELDFARGLKELESKAKTIEVRPQVLKPQFATKKNSAQLLSEAQRLAHDFPEPAVAVAWQAVEDELMATVMRLAISPDPPWHNSAMKSAELLLGQGEIDESTIDVLKRMRNLRNLAVHGHGGLGNVTTDQAIEFIALASGVVEKLCGIKRV